MATTIVPFQFDSVQVRVIHDERNEPWFVLRDVLEAMQSKTTTTNALDSIKQGLGGAYSSEIPLQTAGGVQNVIIIHEAAATFLLARSNTEQGRKLNRFVHVEVLPSIRKTGSYNLQQAVEGDPILSSLMQSLVELAHLKKRQQVVEQEQQRLVERQQTTEQRLDQIETASDHFTIIGWHRYANQGGSLPLAEAARMGKEASRFCSEHEIEVGQVPDPRFGSVKTYPKWVLDELFTSVNSVH